MNECVDVQRSGKPELIHPKNIFFLQLLEILNDKGESICYHVKWEKITTTTRRDTITPPMKMSSHLRRKQNKKLEENILKYLQ